jgi:hypothetical protein
MKKIALHVLVGLLLFSCTKDSSTPAPSIDIANLPKVYTRYYASDHKIKYEVYKYDSNYNLAGISFLTSDTVAGVVSVDSGSYFFNVDQKANLPTGYTSIYRKSTDTKAQVETHTLFFNSKKQVVKDSGVAVISGNNPNPPTKYYAYTDDNVARDTWMHSAAGWNMFLIDSLLITGGNVFHYAQYSNGGSGSNWVVSGQWWVGIYDTHANPFYDKGLSYSFGGYLLLEGIEDFLSKNIANDAGFTFMTDSKGRVVSGTAPDGSYLQVTYQ